MTYLIEVKDGNMKEIVKNVESIQPVQWSSIRSALPPSQRSVFDDIVSLIQTFNTEQE
jgi:hypothetical protein